jgi:hypothetical protein
MVAKCFNATKKRKEKKIIYYIYIYISIVFLMAWQVMTKEVGEIVFEMKENMSSRMRIVDQIFVM